MVITNDNNITNRYIKKAEDERKVRAKNDIKNERRFTIDASHAATIKHRSKHDLIQQVNNVEYTISKTAHRLVHKSKHNNQQVRFSSKPTVARFHKKYDAIIITYDSWADHHCMSKSDRIRLGLPILQAPKKLVGVANNGTSRGKHVTSLPFP